MDVNFHLDHRAYEKYKAESMRRPGFIFRLMEVILDTYISPARMGDYLSFYFKKHGDLKSIVFYETLKSQSNDFAGFLLDSKEKEEIQNMISQYCDNEIDLITNPHRRVYAKPATIIAPKIHSNNAFSHLSNKSIWAATVFIGGILVGVGNFIGRNDKSKADAILEIKYKQLRDSVSSGFFVPPVKEVGHNEHQPNLSKQGNSEGDDIVHSEIKKDSLPRISPVLKANVNPKKK